MVMRVIMAFSKGDMHSVHSCVLAVGGIGNAAGDCKHCANFNFQFIIGKVGNID
jgi:hypothetical protein